LTDIRQFDEARLQKQFDEFLTGLGLTKLVEDGAEEEEEAV
jgi:hypothetical protein